MEKKFIAYSNSKILTTIYDKIGGNIGVPLASFIFLFLLPFLFIFSASFIEDSLFLDGFDVGFLEDIVIIGLMVVFTLIIMISYKFFILFSNLFVDMEKKIIFTNDFSTSDYNKIIENNKTMILGEKKWRKLKFLFHLICLVITIFYALNYAHFNIAFPWDTWRYSTYPLTFFVFTVYQIIMGGFILPSIFWRLITSIISIRKIFVNLNEKLLVVPIISSDNAGGLLTIGKLALVFNFIVALPFFYIIFSVIYWGIINGKIIWAEGTLGLFFYPIVLLILFYVSIIPIHQLMKKSKENENKKLEKFVNKFIVEKDSLKSKEEYLSHIEDLSKLKAFVEQMPEWPYDALIFRSLFAYIIAPIFLLLIQELILRII